VIIGAKEMAVRVEVVVIGGEGLVVTSTQE
jgi:hypothetical protein